NDEQRVLLERHAVDPWPALTRGRSSSRRGCAPDDERRHGALWGRIERPGSHGRQWSSSVGSGDRLDGYWDWLLVLRQLGAEHPGDRTRRRRLRGRARWFDGPADPQHGQLERRLVRERVVRVDLHRQREGTYHRGFVGHDRRCARECDWECYGHPGRYGAHVTHRA